MGLLTFSARHFSEYLHPFFLNFFLFKELNFFIIIIIILSLFTAEQLLMFRISVDPAAAPDLLFLFPRFEGFFACQEHQATVQCTPLSSLTKCRLYQNKKICPTRSQLLRLTSESMLSVAIFERTINNSPIY